MPSTATESPSRDLGDEAGGDPQPGAVVAAVDVLDLPDVLDQAGEHVTTP